MCVYPLKSYFRPNKNKELCWQKGNLYCVGVEQSLFARASGTAEYRRSLYTQPEACKASVLPARSRSSSSKQRMWSHSNVTRKSSPVKSSQVQSCLVLCGLAKGPLCSCLHSLGNKQCLLLSHCRHCWVTIKYVCIRWEVFALCI